MDIKVLGPGCAKCKQTEKVVAEAVAETGVDAHIEKVGNPLDIAKFGIFATPGVVVDGKVKISGKVPTKDQVKTWISQAN